MCLIRLKKYRFFYIFISIKNLTKSDRELPRLAQNKKKTIYLMRNRP